MEDYFLSRCIFHYINNISRFWKASEMQAQMFVFHRKVPLLKRKQTKARQQLCLQLYMSLAMKLHRVAYGVVHSITLTNSGVPSKN